MASGSSTRFISLTVCKRFSNGLECSLKEEKVITCEASFVQIIRGLRVYFYVIAQVKRAYTRNGYNKA